MIWLKAIWYEIFHGGKTYIYDIEAFILSVMLKNLQEPDQARFLLQLKKLDLVQRSPDNKIVALYEASDTYFERWQDVLLENKQKNFMAFRIKLTGNKCPLKNVIAEIYFHEGRISSIEYRDKVKWSKDQEKKLLSGLDWINTSNSNEFEIIKSELFLN